MSRPSFLSLLLSFLLSVVSFAGGTDFVVGTCRPHLKSYSSISAAVSDPATANSTIFVCAGTYEEQVIITQPLTLEGVPVGENRAAIITPPLGGGGQSVTPLSLFGNSAVPNIFVSGAGPVNLKNLVVDGLAQLNILPEALMGIYYLNVSGSITGVVARNVFTPFGGIGIEEDIFDGGSHSFAVTNSNVVSPIATAFFSYGIATFSAGQELTLTLNSNYISGIQGPDGNGGGIYVHNFAPATAKGTIASNQISANRGLLLAGTNLGVTGNAIFGTNIIGGGGTNTVNGNHIDGGGNHGIEIDGTGTNVLKSNTIVNASVGIYGCTDSFFGFPPASGSTVMSNMVLNAATGALMPSGNVLVSNVYNGVSIAQQACP